MEFVPFSLTKINHFETKIANDNFVFNETKVIVYSELKWNLINMKI